MARPQLYMTHQERKVLNASVTNYSGGPNNFSGDYGAAWSRRGYTNRDVALSQIPAWLSGRASFLPVRSAEVFLDVLGDRPELDFLKKFVSTARNGDQGSSEKQR